MINTLCKLSVLVLFPTALVIRRNHEIETLGDDGGETPVDGDFVEGTLACSDEELEKYWERFKIGPKYGKVCKGFTDERLDNGEHYEPWEAELAYVNPDHPTALALYLYPTHDDGGAYSLCDPYWFKEERTQELLMCKRLLTVSDLYSVKLVRVSTTDDAEKVLAGLSSTDRIERLVLGGHGAYDGLDWGDTEEEEGAELNFKGEKQATDAFLAQARPHLAEDAVVFLDSCHVGKRGIKKKNFVQHVAHRLAPAEVCGSTVTLYTHMVDIYADEMERVRIALHNKKGGVKSSCTKFPAGMDRWGYEHGKTCKRGKDSTLVRFDCSSPGKGPRAKMLCEMEQMDQCRQQCEDSADCVAFVFQGAKYRGTNCQIINPEHVHTCKASSHNQGFFFSKPTSSL